LETNTSRRERNKHKKKKKQNIEKRYDHYLGGLKKKGCGRTQEEGTRKKIKRIWATHVFQTQRLQPEQGRHEKKGRGKDKSTKTGLQKY